MLSILNRSLKYLFKATGTSNGLHEQQEQEQQQQQLLNS